MNAPRLTNDRLYALVREYGTLEAALLAPPTKWEKLTGLTKAVSNGIMQSVQEGLRAAERQVREATASGLQVLTWEHPDYPQVLRFDPIGGPPILFVEGRLPPHLDFDSNYVRSCAVVGTRRATPGALGFTRDLARSLSSEGLLVVSGLALGVDGAAHEGALEACQEVAGGVSRAAAKPQYERKAGSRDTPRPAGTLAVLGGGHGHLHPAAHAGLARRIIGSGGAIVSEWAPDVAPLPFRFLRRNRVISGLSQVVLVVEARARSGTNSTVDHALEQGRTVMAVGSAPWSATGASCVAFVEQGAKVVMRLEDVMAQFEDFSLTHAHGASDATSGPNGWPGAARPGTAGRQPALGFGPGEPGPQPPALPEPLNEVLAHLRRVARVGEEFTLDALVGSTAYSTSFLIGALATLALHGVVEATPGGRYRLRHGSPTGGGSPKEAAQ